MLNLFLLEFLLGRLFGGVVDAGGLLLEDVSDGPGLVISVLALMIFFSYFEVPWDKFGRNAITIDALHLQTGETGYYPVIRCILSFCEKLNFVVDVNYDTVAILTNSTFWRSSDSVRRWIIDVARCIKIARRL